MQVEVDNTIQTDDGHWGRVLSITGSLVLVKSSSETRQKLGTATFSTTLNEVRVLQ